MALFAVTVSCDVSELTVVFAAMLVKVILNVYSYDAPGSPVIAAPLFVLTEFAVYVDGRTKPIPLVPVSENVSFDEFDVPDIVTEPPVFATDAVAAIDTNSVFPDYVMVSVFDSTPDAENVAVVVLAVLPVYGVPVQETVSLPLPLVLLGVTHDAYDIIYLILIYKPI